jgi:glutathione S-transferase
VPTLVLADGEVLIESAAILNHLDEAAGEARLIAAAGQPGRAMLRDYALATGLCDKMVSLLYERLLHDEASEAWVARCSAQIEDALAVLEAAREACAAPFWFGATPGHPDIAVACTLRFLAEVHPHLHAPARRPHLAAHAAACEALPAFSSVVQPFSLLRRAPRGMAAPNAASV